MLTSKGIFDSHAHYDDPAFSADRESLLRSMRERGVGRICNVAADLDSCQTSIDLAARYDFVWASCGIHPEFAERTPDGWQSKLLEYASNGKVAAIGEIGLDYHMPDSNRLAQTRLFCEQMELADQLELPVIIHCRDAVEDTLKVLKSFPRVKGVMHCFSASAEVGMQLVEMGWYIGFTGVLTFKNAKKAVGAAQAVPLDRILIETDCPYMAPEPWRGKRCDSSMLSSVVSKLAEIKGIDAEQVVSATYANACEVYRLEKER